MGGAASVIYEQELEQSYGLSKETMEPILILVFSILLIFQYCFKLDAALGIAIFKKEDTEARGIILVTGIVLCVYALFELMTV